MPMAIREKVLNQPMIKFEDRFNHCLANPIYTKFKTGPREAVAQDFRTIYSAATADE